MKIYQVLDYVPDKDAFLVNPEMEQRCQELDICEWHAIVWLGRLLTGNQDFGEHFFDNWDERDQLGLDDSDKYMVVVPARFTTTNGKYCFGCKSLVLDANCVSCQNKINLKSDGPCYSDVVLKSFWTDLFKSLIVSEETLKLISQENKSQNCLFE